MRRRFGHTEFLHTDGADGQLPGVRRVFVGQAHEEAHHLDGFRPDRVQIGLALSLEDGAPFGSVFLRQVPRGAGALAAHSGGNLSPGCALNPEACGDLQGRDGLRRRPPRG